MLFLLLMAFTAENPYDRVFVSKCGDVLIAAAASSNIILNSNLFYYTLVILSVLDFHLSASYLSLEGVKTQALKIEIQLFFVYDFHKNEQ